MTRLKYTGMLMLGAAILMSGCFRQDVAMEPFLPNGDSTVEQIAMAEYDPLIDDTRYVNQVFLDLGTGTMTAVDRTSWDLGFESGPEGQRIILNSANYMQVAWIDSAEFPLDWTQVRVNDLSFAFDSANGDLQYTAIGAWWEHPERVYLIDRGLSNDLQPIGYQQIQIISANEEEYRIRVADQAGTAVRDIRIPKRSAHNFTFLSLETDELVDVEPIREDWDLMFSYYSYRYPDGIPYWLTGALLNRFEVAACWVQDSSSWELLSLADTARFDFSEDIDVIGFDWKTFYFGPPERFITNSDQLYLLRDTEGYFYKLRFLDFYNEEGLKGFPQIEFALLP